MTTTTYEVDPAIGVSRLGSSRDPGPDWFFHGPEPGGSPPEAYRDPAGDRTRRAAPFRVFYASTTPAGGFWRPRPGHRRQSPARRPRAAPSHGRPLSSPADRISRTANRLKICVGNKDSLAAASKALTAVLDKRGIRHEVHLSGGGHAWINWHHYLCAFAPELFR
jgi:hypothetical protein